MSINPALLAQVAANNAKRARNGERPLTPREVIDPALVPHVDPDAPRWSDPSVLGWPPTLPLELALGQSSPKDICEAHNISRERWEELRVNPVFREHCEDAIEMLKKEGMSFRVKARLQAEALLNSMWKLAHAADTPANVKADLMKFIVKASGLSEERADPSTLVGTALQININM